jgi:hypothetical protein
MEDESATRQKKILSILEQEIEEGEEMAAAVRKLAERILLKEKGYSPEDIRKNVAFDVVLGTETLRSRVDFLLSMNNTNAMVIKCASGSLGSRERHVVAAARVLGDLPVPVAVVMDPMSAVVLDGVRGTVLGEGFEAIPTKEQLATIVSGREIPPIPPEKLEREKRVLLAFDAIRCCIPKGADGGVQLDTEQDENSCSCS